MATDEMSKKRKRDVELPDEMLFEILSWLPAKSVCISKCCSKSFLNFTNSSNFALKQSQNSLLKDDSYFFIKDSRTRNTEIHSSLPSYSPREKVGVPSNFLRYVHERYVEILASSNGLLLCRTNKLKQKQLFICNPITQSHSFIPIPSPFFTRAGCLVMLSFECKNNNDEDYELYAIHEDSLQSPTSLVCKTYIPKEGVWKEREPRFNLGKKYFSMPDNQLPVFYNGAIHFLINIFESPRSRSFYRYLASYNVESGVSRLIELPDGASKRSKNEEMGIFKWGEVGSKKESICLVKLKGNRKVGYAFTVWVLRSSGGWSKILCSGNLKELLGLSRKWSQVVGFTVMNGRSLVFATKKEVYDWDLSGKRETRFENLCNHKLDLLPYSRVKFLPYSDTVSSCGIGSTTLRLPSSYDIY